MPNITTIHAITYTNFTVCLRILATIEGHRVISVLGLLLSVLPSFNKPYYYYYY